MICNDESINFKNYKKNLEKYLDQEPLKTVLIQVIPREDMMRIAQKDDTGRFIVFDKLEKVTPIKMLEIIKFTSARYDVKIK